MKRLLILSLIAIFASCSKENDAPAVKQTSIEYTIAGELISVKGGYHETTTNLEGGYFLWYYPSVNNSSAYYQFVIQRGANTFLTFWLPVAEMKPGTYEIGVGEMEVVTANHKGVNYTNTEPGTSFTLNVTNVKNNLVDATFSGTLAGDNGKLTQVTGGTMKNVKIWDK